MLLLNYFATTVVSHHVARQHTPHCLIHSHPPHQIFTTIVTTAQLLSTTSPSVPTIPNLAPPLVALSAVTRYKVAQFSKFDFTFYDGLEDLLNWLIHCEHFSGRNACLHLITSSSHHTINAAWHRRSTTSSNIEVMPSLEHNMELCNLCFRPCIRTSPLFGISMTPFHLHGIRLPRMFQRPSLSDTLARYYLEDQLVHRVLSEHIHVEFQLCTP